MRDCGCLTCDRSLHGSVACMTSVPQMQTPKNFIFEQEKDNGDYVTMDPPFHHPDNENVQISRTNDMSSGRAQRASTTARVESTSANDVKSRLKGRRDVTTDLSREKCGNRLHKQNSNDGVANQGNIDCNKQGRSDRHCHATERNLITLILIVW